MNISRLIKLFGGIFLGLLLVSTISWIQIEWLWYNQFDLLEIFNRRTIFQLIGFVISLLIIFVCYAWQKVWLTQCEFEDRETKENRRIIRFYGLSILATYSIIIVNLSLVSRFAWISLSKPFSLGYWWAEPLEANWKLHIGLIAVFALILITTSKIGIRLIQILGASLFALTVAKGWGVWALGLTINDSGIKEPLFVSDISFGIGKYPAISLAFLLILQILTLTVSTSYWVHLTKSNRLSDWQAPSLSKRQRNILRPFAFLIVLTGAALIWLSRFQYLWSTEESFAGAGWLDVNYNLPLRSSAAIFFLAFGILILIPYNNKIKRIFRTTAFFTSLLCIILEFLLSPLLQWIIVRPRELALESQYIDRAIKATRKAFQLDRIETKLINPNPTLTDSDVILGSSTLRNIRLWDSQPLLATNRQLQQFRVYYKFSNAAVDRYKLNPNSEERQQVMIAARELDQKELPDSSRTWLNRHFVFTHGYGFTVSPVNTKAKDGLPDYFISDLGKSTNIEGSKQLGITSENVRKSIPIERAALYYGTFKSPYAVAPTLLEELDYPEGDQNIFNHYSGSGGVPLTNLWQRISAAIFLKEPRLLNTGVLTKESKLLIKRDVKNRVKSIAPFLDVLGDPYLVSVDLNNQYKKYDINQKQYWIVECYTSSRTYPYSSNLPDGNPLRYIRNSVKAIVDAYNGSVILYISEKDDPIINAWKNIFPSLFAPLSSMPIGIRNHLKVPTDLFDIQVQQLLRYHVTDPRTFYNGDDIWQVPKELYGRQQVLVEPYHITAQLKSNEKSEFLLLQPLAPLARPNLAAWLAARSDGKNYGKLVLLRFPSQTTILGPEQIQALINQDPKISQQFSLWDRAGSEVIQGNLLVLPLGKALLYVEPVYLKASKGGLPTLTRVVVSDGKRIAMEENLSEGLKQLLMQSENTD